MRKYQLLILLVITTYFIACGKNISAQTKRTDSIKQLLASASEDTDKVKIFYNLSNEFDKNDDNKNALLYADSSLMLSKKLRFTSGEIKALIILGTCYDIDKDRDKAITYYLYAKELAEKINDNVQMVQVYLNLTELYKFEQNLPEAFKNANLALHLSEKIGNKHLIAHALLSIGRIYSAKEYFFYDKTSNNEMDIYCTKALKLFEESPDTEPEDIVTCYQFIARAKFNQQNFAEALHFYELALPIWRESGNLSWVRGTNWGIAWIYKAYGDSLLLKDDRKNASDMYNISMHYLFEIEKSFSETEKINSEKYRVWLMDIADIFLLLKNYSKAKNYLTQASLLVTNNRDINECVRLYLSLSKLDSAEGNFKLAYQHLSLYSMYKDSVENHAQSQSVDGFKLQKSFEKKEDSLARKQFLSEAKLKSEKNEKYLYLAGLILLALLSFFVFLNFRNQKKINRLAAEAYAAEKTELQLQSLRAQMNPHFIFNCINSIDAFIHSNDKYNATMYLNKFAKLLRNILDSSKLTTISFSKDIDTLKLYVELEELRHENKFSTTFNIEDELLSYDYRVPALITQPFVENAILHGLKNREDNNGLLQIEIKKVKDHIEYVIKDNGIGRKAAAMIVQNKEASYGMQISYDRIRLFNKEEKPSVQINDLYQDGIATGTEVKILLNIL